MQSEASAYFDETSAFAVLVKEGWLGAKTLRRKIATRMRLVPIRASLTGSASEPYRLSRMFITANRRAVWMPNDSACNMLKINNFRYDKRQIRT
jgi:hypothetical protein